MKFIKTIMMCLVLLSAHSINAQVSAQGVLNDVVDTYKKGKSMSANFLISSAQGQAKGGIIMEGNKFRLLTDEAKSWYNGKTQWTYSIATGEVNITTPTDDELQMGNPYHAINNSKDYNITMQKSDIASNYLLKLTPKLVNSQVREIHLSISKNTSQIVKVVIVADDKSTYVITMSGYKTGVKYPLATFEFNKAEVPTGTVIVDLR